MSEFSRDSGLHAADSASHASHSPRQSSLSHPSPSHDLFHLMFEGADMLSAMWQPMFKSIGRWHLEVAGLGVKNSQAALRLSHDWMRCWTPGDAISANIRFWDAITTNNSVSSQRLAASAKRTVEAVPFAPEIVPLPVNKRGHDVIVIPEATGEIRKVA